MRWRVPEVAQGAWLPFTSHTIPGTLYLATAHVDGPWIMALSDAAHLPVPPSDIAGPGVVRLSVAPLGQLQATLDLIYRQALSHPSLLQTFQTATAMDKEMNSFSVFQGERDRPLKTEFSPVQSTTMS